MNEPLTRHLEHLPDAPPPDALWLRVAEARRRQLRRQRGAFAGGIGACALVLAVVLVPRITTDTAVEAPTTRFAQAQDTDVMSDAQHDALRGIDRELQMAYARNAGEAELDALWAVRRDLAHHRSNAVQPVGI